VVVAAVVVVVVVVDVVVEVVVVVVDVASVVTVRELTDSKPPVSLTHMRSGILPSSLAGGALSHVWGH